MNKCWSCGEFTLRSPKLIQIISEGKVQEEIYAPLCQDCQTKIDKLNERCRRKFGH